MAHTLIGFQLETLKYEDIYRIIVLFSYFLVFPVLVRICILKFSKLKL